MSIPAENLDVKRAQRDEFLLLEAHRRAVAVKAYEVVKTGNIQLPAPEQLSTSIRQIKPDNICRLIFSRKIQNTDRPIPIENFVGCLNPNISEPVEPIPILPKAMNVTCQEKQHLEDLTVETVVNRNSWKFANKQYEKLNSEIQKKP